MPILMLWMERVHPQKAGMTSKARVSMFLARRVGKAIWNLQPPAMVVAVQRFHEQFLEGFT
jgi:hypothetical protein